MPQDARVPKGQLTGKLKDLLRIVLQRWKQTEQATPISSYLKEHKHFSSRVTGTVQTVQKSASQVKMVVPHLSYVLSNEETIPPFLT